VAFQVVGPLEDTDAAAEQPEYLRRRDGARTITSGAGSTIAAHAVPVAAARHLAVADAVICAIFIDPGLDAPREIAGKPCVGLREAAMPEAAGGGRRFAIAAASRHERGKNIRGTTSSGAERA